MTTRRARDSKASRALAIGFVLVLAAFLGACDSEDSVDVSLTLPEDVGSGSEAPDTQPPETQPPQTEAPEGGTARGTTDDSSSVPTWVWVVLLLLLIGVVAWGGARAGGAGTSTTYQQSPPPPPPPE